MRGPGHSIDKCKVLKEHSERYAAKWPNKEARSGSKKKRGHFVRFGTYTHEVNIMAAKEKTTKKGKKHMKSARVNQIVYIPLRINSLVVLTS